MPRVVTPELHSATDRSAPSVARSGAPSRRVWERPELTPLGDLRQLTMGPTPNVGESGNPALRA
jgi:hypothetical protein